MRFLKKKEIKGFFNGNYVGNTEKLIQRQNNTRTSSILFICALDCFVQNGGWPKRTCMEAARIDLKKCKLFKD